MLGTGRRASGTYTVSYRVTDLVRAYDDADGFNFMFVAQNIKPAAEHARITFMRQDEQPIAQEDVKMWAFRYDGDIQWRDGTVVAETASAMDDDQSMIVMLRFEKDFLHPQKSVAGSFEQLKERAFEGSDYNDEEVFEIGLTGVEDTGPARHLFAVAHLLSLTIAYIWWYRHRGQEGPALVPGPALQWQPEEKLRGAECLQLAVARKENLISALVLKLISIGALAIEDTLGGTSPDFGN